jgi:hypothetical protein
MNKVYDMKEYYKFPKIKTTPFSQVAYYLYSFYTQKILF